MAAGRRQRRQGGACSEAGPGTARARQARAVKPERPHPARHDGDRGAGADRRGGARDILPDLRVEEAELQGGDYEFAALHGHERLLERLRACITGTVIGCKPSARLIGLPHVAPFHAGGVGAVEVARAADLDRERHRVACRGLRRGRADGEVAPAHRAAEVSRAALSRQ